MARSRFPLSRLPSVQPLEYPSREYQGQNIMPRELRSGMKGETGGRTFCYCEDS